MRFEIDQHPSFKCEIEAVIFGETLAKIAKNAGAH